MKILVFGVALFTLGCGSTSTPDSFYVEAQPAAPAKGFVAGSPMPLLAGEVNKMELKVGFRRQPGSAMNLKYKVELSAPADVKATTIGGATSWDLDEKLGAGDRGQSLSRTILVKVGAQAVGDREITVTVLPEVGPPVPLVVKCRVGG